MIDPDSRVPSPESRVPSPGSRVPGICGPLLVFPLAAFVLLWEVLIGGRLLLPALYLRGMLPWSTAFPPAPGEMLPQWNILQWDGMAEFYPWRLYAARSFASGHIPLWDPYVLCGTPFLANSQSAPLYPLHLLYYLPLGASIAVRMGWLAFLHLSLAGIFAYLLARDLGAGRWAACLGGLAYELSGFAVAWLELPSFISVACWIPLLLLCLARAVRTGSWRWTAGAGAAGGTMLLGGHLQVAFYGLLAAGCAWLWEAAALRPDRRRLLQALLMGAAILGTAFALAAPQVLPAVELSRMSHRAGTASAEGFAQYTRDALPLRHWITLLAPDFYGLPGAGTYWGYWNYTAPNVMEYAGHVGAAAFVLVVVGLIWGRRVSRRWGFPLLLAVLSLLLAAGSPLARALYFYVPGFSQSGSPARALVLFCLAQALLAAFGWEYVERRLADSWKHVLLPLGAGLGVTAALIPGLQALGLAALPAGFGAPTAEELAVSHAAIVRSIAWAGVLALAVALAVWLFRDNSKAMQRGWTRGAALLAVGGSLVYMSGPYNLLTPPSLAYPDTAYTSALRQLPGRVATLNHTWSFLKVPEALTPPNASLPYLWRDAQGYDSLYLRHYRALANLLAIDPADPDLNADASPRENGNIVFLKHADSPLFPLLAARYVAGSQPLQRDGLRPAAGAPSGPPYLYEDQTALPEAYLAGTWQSDPAEIPGPIQELASAAPSEARALLRGHAWVAGPVSSAVSVPDAADAAVRLERLSPQHLRALAAPRGLAFLVVAEGYAPGWRAVISGSRQPHRSAPVRRCNVAFQGVEVGPGDTTVDLRYEPASFRAGLFFALAALGMLIAVTANCSNRRAPRLTLFALLTRDH